MLDVIMASLIKYAENVHEFSRKDLPSTSRTARFGNGAKLGSLKHGAVISRVVGDIILCA